MQEKGLDYKALTNAGKERYFFSKSSGIPYPDAKCDDWYGYRRHNFVFENCNGFIVEPPHPATGLPWSWCIQWPEAFVPRTPALKLLERGFHHVFLDVYSTYLNEGGVAKLEKFYAILQSLHFHKKCALFGMSYGGLFSLRWAAEHPETVGVMWLDAPVCNLGFAAARNKRNATPVMLKTMQAEAKKHFAAYHVRNLKGLLEHPLNPLNKYQPLAQAKIPILAIRSGQDQSVLPEQNIDLLEEKISSAGGRIQVVRRDLFGHHPHGLDDPSPLVDFILKYYPQY